MPKRKTLEEVRASIVREHKLALHSIENIDARNNILSVLRAGGSMLDAARFVGIRVETIRKWYARGKGLLEGKRPTPRYRKFAFDVDKARVSAKVQALGTVVAAMATRTKIKVGEIRVQLDDKTTRVDYQTVDAISPVALSAAKFYLEATDKRFGTQRQRVELSGAEGGPILVSNPDEIVQTREKVAGLLGRLAVQASAHYQGVLPSPAQVRELAQGPDREAQR